MTAIPAPTTTLDKAMQAMGAQARSAARKLRNVTTDKRAEAITAMAMAIRDRASTILAANEKDMAQADRKGLSGPLLDRLLLTPDRVEAVAAGLDQIARLEDGLGEIINTHRPENGLQIDRVRVPIGVIGIIYESRPNVTADAGALCLKAGNAAILRGGSESFYSSRALHDCLITGLRAADLPEGAIQYVPTTDRAAVGALLSGLDGTVDLIVPRGGKSLVARVEREARVPVLSHLDGINHLYVDKAADAAMARDIVVNAKLRRPGICGAVETVLIHRAALTTCLPGILAGLEAGGCEIRADAACRAFNPDLKPANDADWDTEYLDAIITIGVVDDLDGALDHIARHGSGHTDGIITDDPEAAQIFLGHVDSAIVLHNASTQFADGGEFGFGAEIGIATGRLHARGPVAVEGLTTYKYQVRGTGQTRA
ncbi:MAG: glutamate-5-semialdehyde dehydrogenase [Pseudomonadota bacterium]